MLTSSRRRYAQIERVLQTEIMLRLKAYPVIAIPVPNSTWIPARTAAEKALVARLINQMKASGMLVPGAVDLVVLGRGASCCIELKRPETRTLLGRLPAGRLSESQKNFRDACTRASVNWACCDSWLQVDGVLKDCGVIA